MILTLGLALGCGSEPLAVCEGGSGPERVVDRFWSTLDGGYALFDIRFDEGTHESWEAVGREACDRVAGGAGDDVLFDVLLGMARTLDDGHIQLESKTRDADGWSGYPHQDAVEAARDLVASSYAAGNLRRDESGAHAWGRIGAVGYWSITAMDELSNRGSESRDVEAASAIARQVIGELADTRGLVVDVRANEGGWDTVSLEITRYFSGPAGPVWSKAQRDGPAHDDFTEFEDVEIGAAHDDAYAGPVVLLSSGATFSAGETFVIAMRSRDRVTVLGERTSGHLSDLYDGGLPNGWDFTYSGDRYRAADGEIYEAVGVPVDVPSDFDPAAFAEGRDVMLEAALANLGQ